MYVYAAKKGQKSKDKKEYLFMKEQKTCINIQKLLDFSLIRV